jgi:peptidoglycan hydrolase-like protein with peptidoglycan-binding domain
MTTQPDDESIDTAPPRFDPDVSEAALARPEDEDDDALDPDEEPWSDVDPEQFDDPDEELPVSFGGPVALADTSTRERWLQSALRALVAPKLAVDGEPGPRTAEAVAKFQRRSARLGAGALVVDGIAGPRTIAALEQLTQTKAPAARPASATTVELPGPTATPATDASTTLVHRETLVNGVAVHHIRAGDQEVSFSYWTPRWRSYKPYNVSRYQGARKGLLSDSDIAAVGYGPSDRRILRANAMKESGGAFGAINTWDDQIVSWGMAQFAGQAGTLAVLLARLKEGARTRPSFDRWFRSQGIDVARGKYPWKNGSTRSGWHVVITTDGETHRGNDGWKFLRTQPRLIGAFLLAGNDPAIQLGQLELWRTSFLARAIEKQVSFASGPGGPIRRYVTSERGLAIVVRLHNWMPAHVVKWSNRFIAELEREHPGRDLSDPFEWDQALEDAFVQKLSDERKRVKKGSYDQYALDLGRTRGSYVGGG